MPSERIDSGDLRPWQRRLLFTLGAIVAYLVGTHVPLPGIDRSSLSRIVEATATVRDYDAATGGALARASVLSLGIVPYLSAATIILLLSGMIPALRSLRDGSEEANARFDSWIMRVTLVVALLQGYGLALLLGSSGAAPEISPIVTTLVLAGGALGLAWLAGQMTRKGLVNGVVVIVFVDLATSAYTGARKALISASSDQSPLSLVLLLGAAIAICVIVVRSTRTLPLLDRNRPSIQTSNGSAAPRVALHYNTAGVLPLGIAYKAMSVLALVGAVVRQSTMYWVIQSVAIVLVTYAWTAITFDPADLLRRVQRFGYRVATDSGDDETAEGIDHILERMVLPYAAFLVALSIVPKILRALTQLPPDALQLAGAPAMTVAAIGVAVRESVLTLRAQLSPEEGEEEDDAEEWVDAYEGETDLDIELARVTLARAGVESISCSDRATCITGTVAFWSVSRPRFPSLTFYRRLGSGRARAQVRAPDLERARSVLASLPAA